jgi:hypothetical protein
VTSYLDSHPEIEEVYVTRCLYWHWFAIELVGVYNSVSMQVKEERDTISVKICDNEYDIKLMLASQNINAASSLIERER